MILVTAAMWRSATSNPAGQTPNEAPLNQNFLFIVFIGTGVFLSLLLPLKGQSI